MVESIPQETAKARQQAKPKTAAAPTGAVVERGKVKRPLIRYHGAKFRLAPWIMGFFPPHRIYVEPFGGAAGVLIQKPRSYAEVYNDLDGDVVNLFRVLQNPTTRQHLVDLVVLTPYSRDEFELAYQSSEDSIENARRLCIRASMGFGSAGATKGNTGFRIDTKREYETAQHTWAMYPDAIANAGKRLSGVLIENKPAQQIIPAHDSKETLYFIDPPYVHETRVMGGNRTYQHEMNMDEHIQLLKSLLSLKGMVVLSGYQHDIYDQLLVGWEKHTTKSRISAGRGTALRTECVWLNPACFNALNGNIGGLFNE